MAGQRFANFAGAVPGTFFNIWNENAGAAGPVDLVAAVTINAPNRLLIYGVDIEGASGALVSIIDLQLSTDGGGSFATVRKFSLNHAATLQPMYSRNYPTEAAILDTFGVLTATVEQVQVKAVLTQVGGTARVSAGFVGREISSAA